MERHRKKHLATLGLEPGSPVSVRRHANKQRKLDANKFYFKLAN